MRRLYFWLSLYGTVLVSALLVLMASAGLAAPVNISLWHIESPGTPANTVIEQIVDNFNAEHRDIHIDVQYVQFTETGAFAQKLSTAIAAGVGPDVVEVSGNWLVTLGGALPLDEYMKRSRTLKLDLFFPSQLQRAQLDGKLWGIPNHTDSRLMFYNADRFREVGLTTPPATWDEAYKASQKLIRTGSDGVLTHAGLVPHNGQGWFYIWAATNGVSLVDYDWWLPPASRPKEIKPLFNTPAGEKVLEFMSDMVDLHGGMGALSAYSNTVKGSTFLAGRTAMLVEGSWNVPNWRTQVPNLDWQVAPIPHGPSGSRATYAGGFMWQITKETKHPDEAFAVIEYLVSLNNNVAFCSAGYFIPVRRDALSSPVFTKDPIFRAFIAEMEYAVPFPSVPFSSAMWDALNLRARDAVLNKKLSPKAALDTAAREVEAAIASSMQK